MNRFNSLKKVIVESLLSKCPFIGVYTRHPGLVLHERYTAEPWVTLRLGQDPNVINIRDLVIDERGWRGTLCTGGALSFADVPWEAVCRVYELIDAEGGILVPMMAQWEYVEQAQERVRPGLRLV